jgi:ABC-type multidrug transport system ATPase subunit
MKLYAMIKGVPENRRVIVIEDVLTTLTLSDERSKLACNLSGGN